MARPSPFRPTYPRRRLRTAAVWLLSATAGCSFVPKTKLDECHRLSQTLRAENTRVKDQALDLRAQNQELTQRAVDDARRISAQQEAVDRLEQSVAAYQTEREKLADAFEAVKRQVRLAATTQPSASLGDRLRDFAGAREGWVFDPKTETLTVAADRLFARGSATPRPEAGGDLKALAEALKGAVPEGQSLEVIGLAGTPPLPDPSGVRRTGFTGVVETEDGGDGVSTSGRFLGSARAGRVRAALIGTEGIDAGRVRLAAPDPAEAADTGTARGVEDRMELRVVSRPAANEIPATPPGRSRPEPGTTPRAAGLDSGPDGDK